MTSVSNSIDKQSVDQSDASFVDCFDSNSHCHVDVHDPEGMDSSRESLRNVPGKDVIKGRRDRKRRSESDDILLNDEQDLIGDFSKPHCLQLAKSKHNDLKSVLPQTVSLCVNITLVISVMLGFAYIAFNLYEVVHETLHELMEVEIC